jgi:hypothetical protein
MTRVARSYESHTEERFRAGASLRCTLPGQTWHSRTPKPCCDSWGGWKKQMSVEHLNEDFNEGVVNEPLRSRYDAGSCLDEISKDSLKR